MKPAPLNTSPRWRVATQLTLFTYMYLCFKVELELAFKVELDFILISERKKYFTVGSTAFPDPQARS